MNSNLTRIKILIFVVFALGANLTTRAQSLGESRIKAAYMVNFIKHITWPNEPSKTNFRLVIYRDRNFYQFLSASLTDKSIKGKAIDVIFVRSIDAMKNADLVYVPEQFNAYLHQIANVLRGSQTLLISDNSREKHDVMINLIHKDHSSVISFEVNKSNIVYEKLTMSSKLKK